MSDRPPWVSGQPALRLSALWFVGLAAMLYFPTLGPTLGLGVSDSFRFALLIDMWWCCAVLLMTGCGALLRSRPMLGWLATVLVQAGCLIGAWLVILPWASGWALASAWLRTAAWMPAAVLVVGCLSYLVIDRRRFAVDRAVAESELGVLAAQTRALLVAHARIVEEARSESRNVASAVRAAMRMAQDDALHGRELRTLLDADVRASAREASHRVHDLAPGSPEITERRRRRTLGQWLDVLAAESNWHVTSGLGMVGAAVVPGILLTHGRTSGTVIALCSLALALLVSFGISGLLRLRAEWSRAARRAILLLCFWLGVTALVAPSVFVTPTVETRDAWITVLLTAPALMCVGMLPLVLAAGGERRIALRAELRAEVSLATARRDAAGADLEELRHAVVATLHTHVQGRAAAAITAMDLAEAGVPGTREILDAVLEELADLDIDVTMRASASAVDPIAAVLDSWRGVLDVSVGSDELTSTPVRFTMAEHLQNLIVNAVVHGHARTIEVTLAEDVLCATCTVIDDGIGPRRGYAVGLGFRGIDSAGGSWTLTRAEGRTTAVVRFPRSSRAMVAAALAKQGER